MQAVNHVATALILKRTFPSAPLFGLILATEAMEYVWVGLNVIGVERTVIDEDMRSVANVHLVHMPFSHSVVTSLVAAASIGLIVMGRGGKAASVVALAIALGVVSHVLLDLSVHAPDIVLAPFLGGARYGTGLYANLPLPALALETLWGALCWRVYRGSWKLLGLMVFLGIASIPLYSVTINAGEAALGGQSTAFALVILAQMLATSGLFWMFARERRGAPDSDMLAAPAGRRAAGPLAGAAGLDKVSGGSATRRSAPRQARLFGAGLPTQRRRGFGPSQARCPHNGLTRARAAPRWSAFRRTRRGR